MIERTLPAEPERPIFSANLHFPWIVRMLAHLFSIVFHPLFIPVMAAYYLVFIQPGYFTGISANEKSLIVLRVGYNTIFFPAITVVLLKAVGFIKSILLKSKRDRIIPYIATNIFYFWMYLVLKNNPEIPPILISFIFGIFLGSTFALIANIYFKISMHALGMGAFTGLILVIIFSGFQYLLFLPAMVVFLLTGLVCTSRLIVSDHTPFEIYTGLLFAIICQFVAYIFIGL